MRLATLALLLLAGCGPKFPPHPGQILLRQTGKPDRIESAATVPDSIKFIYEDKSGTQLDSPTGAAHRIPVVEIDAVTAPGANTIEIFEYGPHHQLLKTTIGTTGP